METYSLYDVIFRLSALAQRLTDKLYVDRLFPACFLARRCIGPFIQLWGLWRYTVFRRGFPLLRLFSRAGLSGGLPGQAFPAKVEISINHGIQFQKK